jgi:hypothetical protein
MLQPSVPTSFQKSKKFKSRAYFKILLTLNLLRSLCNQPKTQLVRVKVRVGSRMRMRMRI